MPVHSNIYRLNTVVKVLASANKRLTIAKIGWSGFFGFDFF